ncbi:MAG: phosphoglycolate phosphatase [Hyphomicrobiaceae bacterium]
MRDLTIAFDLDGTLVETAPDLVRATNHALALAGLPAVTPASLRGTISFGARAMIEHGLAQHRHTLPTSRVDDLLGHFLAHYADNIATESHAYPGLERALAHIAARGVAFVVCTNKQEGLSRKLLDELQMTHFFAAIAGRDTFPVYKPHPDHLTGAIRLAGGDPARAIMVGDSDTDIKTARAAGIPVIGVPFGYTDVPIHALDPDIVIDHYDDLERAVERLHRR